MGRDSGISWTDHTFNPWWGCVKIGPGGSCHNCYAADLARRFGFKWGPGARRRFFGVNHWREPMKWDATAAKDGASAFVFCASMADVFEQLPAGHPDTEAMDAARADLWALIEQTPHLVWLLLTKRPQNAARMVASHWAGRWPVNAWLGTTAEDQPRAQERLPALLGVHGPGHRFVSYEPALGPVDWLGAIQAGLGRTAPLDSIAYIDGLGYGIDWLICGAESGPKARPIDIAWARDSLRQCADGGTAFWMKQVGARPIGWEGPRPNHPSGADPEEWPGDIRVQERPEATVLELTAESGL